MFQCFHCLNNTLVWQSDFSFEDLGYEGEGIIHYLICSHCGAEVEYKISLEEKEEE